MKWYFHYEFAIPLYLSLKREILSCDQFDTYSSISFLKDERYSSQEGEDYYLNFKHTINQTLHTQKHDHQKSILYYQT